MNTQSSTNTDVDISKVTESEKFKLLQSAMDSTFAFLNSMQDGEKTNLAAVSEAVSKDLDVKVAVVQPFVNMAVHQFVGVRILRGRYGGIIKGGVAAKKEDDVRPRCTSCKQVIRTKKQSKGSEVETKLVHVETASTETDATANVEDEFEEFLEDSCDSDDVETNE